MPEGLQNFLDRVQSEVEKGPDHSGNPNPTSDNTPPADPPSDGLDDLTPPPASPTSPSSDDPLDNLDPEPQDAPKAEDTPTPPTGEFLDTFDQGDRDKIQAYIDEQVANEVTEGEAAGGAFKRIKAQLREATSRISELETNSGAEDSEALSAATKEIADLKDKLKAAEGVAQVTNLESTEAWRSEIVEPLHQIVDEADDVLSRYPGVDRDTILNALEIKDRRKMSDAITKAFDDAEVEIAEADKFDLYGLARQVDKVYSRKQELRDNAESALEEANRLQGEIDEKAALERRQARESSAQEVAKRLQDKAAFVVEIVGQEVIDNAVQSISDSAEVAPGDEAFNRITAQMFAPMARHIRSLQQQVEEMSDTIAAYKKTTPGGGATPGGNPKPTEDNGARGIKAAADRIGQAIGSIGSM